MVNQEAYCKSKGYLYEVYEQNLAKDSLPYWTKIAGINRLLNGKNPSQWIVWLDDDAVITNGKIGFDKVIKNLCDKYPNIDIFVTEDVPYAATKLNTGVLIVRNSDFSRNFFQELFNMRHTVVPRYATEKYTYANCPGQSCLHEQEAMHNLLLDNPNYLKHVKIIPQREPNGVGMNTFMRFNHLDDNRGGIHMTYGGDPESSLGKPEDFIVQCTGLSTKGRLTPESPQMNLREACIDHLIQNSIRA